MFCNTRHFGLGALVLLACWCLASSAQAQSVPHKETSTGQLINVTATRMDWVAAGRGTHYGNYTETGYHYYFADGSLFGFFTVTTADGSTCSGAYEGTFAPIGDGLFKFEVDLEWLEGTGRLAGTTGIGTATAILDGTTGAIVIDAGGLWDRP